MEAAPRLPMISFELKVSTEPASFGPKLKQYIAGFYHEDPESYNNEIHNLESLRATAVRPAIDVTGCQMLKKYYCQLNFLKSRFPMEKSQSCAMTFSWKDLYAGLVCSVSDIDFELSSVLYNIGALHTQLGAADSRSSSEGMKMSCTHFQCAAWAFQHLKEHYSQLVSLSLAPEVIHFMYQLCLAQAQECILEKSMMDNRKSTIIAKVAVQVVDYYNQAISTLLAGSDEGSMGEIVGSRVFKDWSRYLKFKVAYHSCVSFLYQGQQAEEQQKMGERVAYYQAASEQLEQARKIAKNNMGHQQHEVDEALGFTQDVVEGKKKAAKNENEFIYHEVVPERDALQQVNGASLVKGIAFSVNDPEVSGADLFQRLVPMEAHEASSVYSEQKAEMLRQIGAIVDSKDGELAEFMSSLQLDCLTQFRQATGVPQDVIDRAAAICAKPQATHALVEAMGKLASIYHDVESLLGEIQEQVKEEESKEQSYQKIMGSRPPSIVSTDLSREAGKYTEAHSKANESNQTLHRAMTMHMANLKVLAQPLAELKKAIPSTIPGDPAVDEVIIKDLESLVGKVDEMRAQRATLVAQLREAVCADDITTLLVTKPPNLTMDQLFQRELNKHKRQAALIEQNLAAQENILAALTDIYAKFAPTRRYIADLLKRRDITASALIASYDAYDDLLAKANKGIEFYQKLEGNVTKLQQRVKSACRVNEEEREQMLAKSGASIAPAPATISANPAAPKLKDYLASMKATSVLPTATVSAAVPEPVVSQWLPAVRPTPLGSEETSDKRLPYDSHYAGHMATSQQYQPSNMAEYYAASTLPTQYGAAAQYGYSDPSVYYSQYTSTKPPNDVKPSVAAGNSTVQPPHKYPSAYGAATPDQVPHSYQSPPLYSAVDTSVGAQKPQQLQNYPIQTDTNTLPSQHQQNYHISSTYSRSVNTKAPSQQSGVNYQTPTGYGATTDKYAGASEYPAAAYQQQQPPTAEYQPGTNSTGNNATASSYSSGYGYPINYHAVNEASTAVGGYGIQYQYQYPQQYYPTSNYQSSQQQPTPVQGYAQDKPQVHVYPQDPSQVHLHSQQQLPQIQVQQPPVQEQPPVSVYSQYIPQMYQYSQSQPYSTQTQSTYGYSQNSQVHAYSQAQHVSQAQVHGYSQAQQNSQAPGHAYSQAQQNSQAPGHAYSQAQQNSQAPGHAYSQAQQNSQAPGHAYSQPQTSAEVTAPVKLQYTNAGTNNTFHTDSQAPMPASATNAELGNYYTTPYGYQTLGMNPMTMVHANTNLTSSSKSTMSVSSPSNVDLLAGLDFTVNQTPLQPQVHVTVPERKEQPAAVVQPTTPASKPARHEVVAPEQKKVEIVQDIKAESVLSDPEALATFSQEVDKLEKFVDGLTTKTLNGPTPLDIKWKEIQEQQERHAQKCSISVARCYPMKNRMPDIMPYDHSRVELPSTKDDYINASHVRDIATHSPPFIVTQAPLKSTLVDFWAMVCEQQVELIVCMLADTEIQQAGAVYWPVERGDDLTIGKYRLALQSVNAREHWIERIISVSDGSKNLVVVHLQFTGWPGGGLFPTSVAPLLGLAAAVLTCHRQQRARGRPVLLHCLSGVGRSGILCVLVAAMYDPVQMLDVSAAVSRMSHDRKNILRDREHLKFAYQAVLQHAKDLLAGRQLQARLQNVTIASDESQSRRSSTSSDTTLDQPKLKKKFTPESFESLKEQGIAPAKDTTDPLSALDPLWTIRK
ncbi:myopic [Carabus blaptoides fortunei]